MKKYTATLQDSAGNAISSQPVHVYVSGTTTHAALFDDFGNPMSNPLTTVSDGTFSFRVFSGTYDLVDGSNNPYQTGVQIFDMQNQGEWLGPSTSGRSPFVIGSTGKLSDQPGLVVGTSVFQQLGPMAILSNGQLAPGGDVVLRVQAEATYPQAILELWTGGQTYPNFKFTPLGANPPFLLFSDGTFDPLLSACGLQAFDDTTLMTLGGFTVQGAFYHIGTTAGFFTATPISKPAVSGSRHEPSEGTAAPALTSLLNALALLGLINNTTTT